MITGSPETKRVLYLNRGLIILFGSLTSRSDIEILLRVRVIAIATEDRLSPSATDDAQT